MPGSDNNYSSSTKKHSNGMQQDHKEIILMDKIVFKLLKSAHNIHKTENDRTTQLLLLFFYYYCFFHL